MKKILFILVGILLVSVGVTILKFSEIATGGTAGLALSLSYLTQTPFSLFFFLVNIPFYIFSVLRMGWKFTLSTIFAVSTLSIVTTFDQFLPSFSVPIWLGAIVGGAIIGVGLSILFANGSSLGGANILALFLHKRYQFNPGKTTFLFDFIVVLTSLYAVGFVRGLASVLSIAVTSMVISYFKNRIAEKQEQPAKNEKYKVGSDVAVSQ
ncbi:YitT family protein [Aquibacillus koreensis]|uniref:YitT family protein n=1 Tax=Aquibacillus koreensis TaxID=279446 RepID=A0A9X3WPY0_9BACI|nr:YitT family protein [Aquibacillus koreensis]MCT2537747.1 YitT family protein [Aquibacillus koreensis]MDC3421219.1 YitT family protein [Aquibacillus koreensis]